MKEIKDLIEKYYEGGTSLEEEKKLSDFFRKGDIPEELQLYKKSPQQMQGFFGK